MEDTRSPKAIGGVKEKVLAWLGDDGWMANEAADPQFAWLLVAAKEGRTLVAAEAAGRGDGLFLRYQVNLPETDRSRLQRLPRRQLDQFVWDLWSAMQSAGVEFHADGPIPTRLLITVNLFYDAPLSKDLFMRRFLRLNAASNLVGLAIRKALGMLLDPVAAAPPDLQSSSGQASGG